MLDRKLTEKIIKKFHKILKYDILDSRIECVSVGEYKQRLNIIGSGIRTMFPK